MNLDQPVPVHLEYRTAITNLRGGLQFRRDIYGRDGRIWTANAPVVDGADFPPAEADEALEPGHRKSITILRGFAEAPADNIKPKRMVFDFFAKPVRIEGDGGVSGWCVFEALRAQ